MTLHSFRAVEFNAETNEETGNVETYYSENLAAAVESVRYFHQICGRPATIGPTGRVVYAGGLAYTVHPDRS